MQGNRFFFEKYGLSLTKLRLRKLSIGTFFLIRWEISIKKNNFDTKDSSYFYAISSFVSDFLQANEFESN